MFHDFPSYSFDEYNNDEYSELNEDYINDYIIENDIQPPNLIYSENNNESFNVQSILNISGGNYDNFENKNTIAMTPLSKQTQKKKIFKSMKILNKKCYSNIFNVNNEKLKSKENCDNNIIQKEREVNLNEREKNNNQIIINLEEGEEDNNNNNFKINGEKNKVAQNLQYGRKSKNNKLKGIKGKHTKNDKDNIIRKIKSFFGKSLYKYINKSFIGEEQLLKLNIDINRKLKRDYNLELFEMTLRDIYMNTEISDKYKNKDLESNAKTINKIYLEKKEIEVIKILNLTYYEAFEIFINPFKEISYDLKQKIEGTSILNNQQFGNIEILLNNVVKNKEKNEDIQEYIDDIIYLCINFKQWFKNKTGRFT